jgi:hypothetical protein
MAATPIAPAAPPAAHVAFMVATATAWLDAAEVAASVTMAAVGDQSPDAAEPAMTAATLRGQSAQPALGVV